MPIKRENRHLYAPNWKEISRDIRFGRAKGLCEQCGAVNGQPHPVTGSRVVLTVAHLDHDPTNNDRSNLRALCQRDHFAHDAEHHRTNAAETRRRKMQTRELF